jgi:hypothetical protein
LLLLLLLSVLDDDELEATDESSLSRGGRANDNGISLKTEGAMPFFFDFGSDGFNLMVGIDETTCGGFDSSSFGSSISISDNFWVGTIKIESKHDNVLNSVSGCLSCI